MLLTERPDHVVISYEEYTECLAETVFEMCLSEVFVGVAVVSSLEELAFNERFYSLFDE